MLKLRIGAAVVIAVIVVLIAATSSQLDLSTRPLDLLMLVTLIDAGKNNILLLAATVFFLVTIETRVKRKRFLRAIQELRSLAHIIDMHQLNKDPDRLIFPNSETRSSPTIEMDVFEMSRYLDYCSEMLSLTGKVASIYSLTWQDGVAVQAVNEVEGLTGRISQKIFQKTMILHSNFNVVRGSTI